MFRKVLYSSFTVVFSLYQWLKLCVSVAHFCSLISKYIPLCPSVKFSPSPFLYGHEETKTPRVQSWVELLQFSWSRCVQTSRAQRMMGTVGLMLTGVPESLLSALLQLNNITPPKSHLRSRRRHPQMTVRFACDPSSPWDSETSGITLGLQRHQFNQTSSAHFRRRFFTFTPPALVPACRGWSAVCV